MPSMCAVLLTLINLRRFVSSNFRALSIMWIFIRLLSSADFSRPSLIMPSVSMITPVKFDPWLTLSIWKPIPCRS